MKKLIFGLLALLVLSSCKKSGSVDVVVNDDIRSIKYDEVCHIEDRVGGMDEELEASYNLFSVVPGTYKIEYYQNEFSKIAYNIKLTIKLHLNHSLYLTENFYSSVSENYFHGEDIHSKAFAEIWRKRHGNLCDMGIITITLYDAEGKEPVVDRLAQLIPPYCDESQKDALRKDAVQQFYEFVTSPAGTEKEITMYGSGGPDTPNEIEKVTNLSMKVHVMELSKNNHKYGMIVYKD